MKPSLFAVNTLTVMSVNVDGVISCVREFLPLMKPQDEGCIAITSSLAAFFPTKFIGAPYSVSKYAVRGFAEVMLVEAQRFYPHINVACIHAGLVQTSIVDNTHIAHDPRTPMSTPEAVEVARAHAKQAYERFGTTCPKAVRQILAGVKAGESRIMVRHSPMQERCLIPVVCVL